MADSLPFGKDVEDLVRELLLHGLTARNRDGYLTPVIHMRDRVFPIALTSADEMRAVARSRLMESDKPDAYTLIMYDGQVTIERTTAPAIVVEYLTDLEDQREVFAFRYRLKTEERGLPGALSIDPLGGVVRLAT